MPVADNDLVKRINKFFARDPAVAVAHEIYQALDDRWNDELITTSELEEVAHGLRYHGDAIGRLIAEKLNILIKVERDNERRKKERLARIQRRKEELQNG